MICSFVIYMTGLVAHVRIKRVERIRITPDWVERAAAEDIAALRFIASSPGISRELWIYTPKGAFRFFRVLDDSLVEIDRSGQLMPDQPPAPKIRTPRSPVTKRRKDPSAPAGKPGDPVSSPGPAGSVAEAPAPPSAGNTADTTGTPGVSDGPSDCQESSDLRQEKDVVLRQEGGESSRLF